MRAYNFFVDGPKFTIFVNVEGIVVDHMLFRFLIYPSSPVQFSLLIPCKQLHDRMREQIRT